MKRLIFMASSVINTLHRWKYICAIKEPKAHQFVFRVQVSSELVFTWILCPLAPCERTQILHSFY